MIKVLTCDATCFVPTKYCLSAPETLLDFYFALSRVEWAQTDF